MKKVLEIALGIVTSIGGFLEAGSIATAAQAGASYNYQLIWPIVLGTICVVFLIEMSGRLAAISHHPLPAAVRDRFGINYFVIPFVAENVVDLLVLASEIGGCCLALQLATGLKFQYFALPVTLFAWLLLWFGTFGIIEYGISTLGLAAIVFVVAALRNHPEPAEAVKGLLPTLPSHDKAHYWFLAVSIMGATISPYLFNFYSSGGVEDEWDETHLTSNRIVATLGMGFGGTLSLAVLIASAAVLHPLGVDISRYEQIPLIVTTTVGKMGYWIFVFALFICCFGAMLELTLDSGYVYSQAFGWSWSENLKPRDATRFHATYSIFLLLACLPIALGMDPLKLTLFSMAFTTVILPVIVLPFLVLMNDPAYVEDHGNGRFSNIVVFVIVILAAVMAIVAIPLEIVGGS